MSSVSLSGGISATLFSSLQKSQATDRSQQLFSKLDTNGDGSIDSTELKTFADDLSSKTGTKIDASSLMTALDSDGNGSVTSTELKDNGKALFDQLRQQLMGSQLQAPSGGGKPDAAKLFSSIDTDGDGSISASEFKAGMQHGPHGPPPGGPPPAQASDSSTSSDSSDTSSDYISKLVASLIAQYGATQSDATTSGSTLSVAA